MASSVGKYESCEWSSLSLNISHDTEESLLTTYRRFTLEFEFTSIQAFQGCCLSRYNKIQDGSSNCNEYILFMKVSLEHMIKVDQACRLLPKMCCLYDVGEEVLLVKLISSIDHQIMSRLFFGDFYHKLRNLGLNREITPLGSTRFGGTRRHKEANESFKPQQTRPAIDDWPSTTCEVGFFESLPQLRLDAHYWLTHCPPQLRTNIVILIHIKRNERKFQIDRWEVVNPRRSQHANVQYPSTCDCVQHIKLSEGTMYTGPLLELLVQKIFDILPPNVATDALNFTVAELQYMNDTFWMHFPLTSNKFSLDKDSEKHGSNWRRQHKHSV